MTATHELVIARPGTMCKSEANISQLDPVYAQIRPWPFSAHDTIGWSCHTVKIGSLI